MSTDDIPTGMYTLYISGKMKDGGVPADLVSQALAMAQRFPAILKLCEMWCENPRYREAIIEDLRHAIETDPLSQTVEAWNAHYAKYGSLADSQARTLYGVFGYLKVGEDRECLGMYSTKERAEALIRAQSAYLQMFMRVEPFTVDAYPEGPDWVKPS